MRAMPAEHQPTRAGATGPERTRRGSAAVGGRDGDVGVATSPSRAAVRALQGQAGNHATARLLQRQPVHAMGPGMTGGAAVEVEADAGHAREAGHGREAGPAPATAQQDYAVVYAGMEFRVPRHEMPALLRHIGPALWTGAIGDLDAAYAGVRAEYRAHVETFRDQAMVGSVLQLVTGARLPHEQLAAADEALRAARTAVLGLIKDPSPRAGWNACEAVRNAETLVEAAGTAVGEYRASIIGGGETTVFALEITRDVSFAVAAAAGSAVLVPAGATLGTTVAAGALAEGSAALVKELATAGGRSLAGTAASAEDTLTEIAYGLAKGTVLGGVGGLFKPVSTALGDRLAARLAQRFTRLGDEAAKYLAGQIVDNVISAKISIPVDIIEKVVRSQDPVDCEELLEYLTDQAARRGLEEGVKGLVP